MIGMRQRGHERGVAGECELRGQEPGGTACCRPQFQGRRHGVPPSPGIGAGCGRQAQSAQVFADGHSEV